MHDAAKFLWMAKGRSRRPEELAPCLEWFGILHPHNRSCHDGGRVDTSIQVLLSDASTLNPTRSHYSRPRVKNKGLVSQNENPGLRRTRAPRTILASWSLCLKIAAARWAQSGCFTYFSRCWKDLKSSKPKPSKA